MVEQSPPTSSSSRLIAFTLVGEGLSPAFADGEVIVIDRLEAPKPGARAVVELTNGRALLVRLLKVSKPGGLVSVEHLVSRDRVAYFRHEIAFLSSLRAIYSRGHAPRVGIDAWREMPTDGGLR